GFLRHAGAVSAVDGDRGDVDDAPHPRLGERAEHVLGPLDVGPVVILPAPVAEREEGRVRDHRPGAGEAAREPIALGQVGLAQLDAARGELGHAAGVPHHPDHARPAREEHVDEVAAEEAGRPGHRDGGTAQVHRQPPGSRSPSAATNRSRTASVTASTGSVAKLAWGISSSTRTWIACRPCRTKPRFGSALAVPSITMGSIGAPVRCASVKAPGLKARSRPSGERVPSGNIMIELPWASARSQAWSARAMLSRLPRRSLMQRLSDMFQPKTGT